MKRSNIELHHQIIKIVELYHKSALRCNIYDN